jgi:hypothetical protein
MQCLVLVAQSKWPMLAQQKTARLQQAHPVRI